MIFIPCDSPWISCHKSVHCVKERTHHVNTDLGFLSVLLSFLLIPLLLSVFQGPAHWTVLATSLPTQLHTSPLFLLAGKTSIYVLRMFVFAVTHVKNTEALLSSINKLIVLVIISSYQLFSVLSYTVHQEKNRNKVIDCRCWAQIDKVYFIF